ncbi:Ribosomal protein S18 acetylase RimI [Sphingomonas gellani]|uniref:Ribosomal protein S18 acetylase RimI n=1 Tax=Sphingomonas gellani TaxID=1166340 RepID=A0A1H7ZS10_9SPHN|nr:GNAT family N-acetyltransferase [Sphingomonas gellani]SEM61071.1 Ribosomal protein S18 acetylase RimI [Sphingomonas gellani]
MTKWRLRRASVDDAPAAALIAGASFLETFAGVLRGADIVAHVEAKSSPAVFAAWAHDDRCVVTLVEHQSGAAPIGYSVLTPPDFPIAMHARDIELRRIYVLSRFHGAGLGPALMTRAVADAQAMGMSRLLLGVLSTNTRARAFYEKQGFSLCGERRFKVGGSWFDDVVYGRDL